MTDNRLLTFANAKTPKGEKRGYLTAILYLVPADGFDRMEARADNIVRTLCPNASPQCIADCLFTAGRGIMRPIAEGRMRKTRLFFADTVRFVDLAGDDIARAEKRAAKRGLILCVRLNGTSDVPWERMRGSDGRTLMERFPHVQFYDYTKRPNRETGFANYHLTFSRSECNESQCIVELQRGRNVAVVFATRKGEALPLWWHGFRVVDGDESDLRFLDGPHSMGPAVIIGLRAKGKARQRCGGFVVPVEPIAMEV